MPDINFFSEIPSFSFDNTSSWSDWLIACAEEESFSLTSLNVIGMTDAQLLELNQQYLDHDTLTDVITFPLSIGKDIEGEVYISVERAIENAYKHKVGTSDELHRLSIHGLLHLMGYSDKKPDEQELMTSKEDYYLNSRTF